ncbi:MULTISPECIES: mannonate dehydratase [Sphingobacterium]|uniref:Mannonate dehydratase n=1 Tax=Sphingobacterium cellulitidis TaxID=1768011 RepID=A0A8H9FZ64_9SPHI|nr:MULTISPECIES: mannonate dehydratase [Sphingobacterium]MBA8985781.1 mannonate dehydratase [Sphingobacterium soli]WFB64192.1 mannonate dehydratase [Sphingobacterium sp. WM]GGE06963.1 mannonate dehydratase [Sphingobacterium soli]
MENKKYLEQTWRWYGPNDPVTLQDVKQAGATGIVSALHHIPHGEVWPLEDIQERKRIIEEAGLTWSVVESVPVHEAIKTRSAEAGEYIERYKKSLENLAACGIKTICYNFMPVLDWTRTQLDLIMKDGSKALYFDWIDLAIFDIYILKREDAAQDYSDEIQQLAQERFAGMSEADKTDLQFNVLMGIPGEADLSLESLQQSIDIYKNIGREGLKQNLLYFLGAIADTCEANGIKMTIHPDDPPYAILGLPRVVSNEEDLVYLITEQPKSFNGICFCTGSLGAGPKNNLPQILNKVKHRVYFAHLRNVKRDAIGSFYEADHLDGDVDMYAIVKGLSAENQTREVAIPFRPDHGHQMLDDINKVTNPGYSAIGRLRGLAELRGLELGIIRS